MTDLRYPIGPFEYREGITPAEREKAIQDIAATPELLRQAVAGLNNAQLDTRYRPEGWTVRQVVHHLPDSHVNSYVRFKLALTEDEPTIRPYDEAQWAELPDSREPIDVSLHFLEGLHGRWVKMLRAIKDEEWARRLRHPEVGTVSLGAMVAVYGWHGRHHVAHITSLRERKGW